MGYELQWELKGVVKRYFGTVSSHELIASVLESQSNERFDTLRYAIYDFLNVRSVVLTRADIDDLAALTIGAAATNQKIRVAVVAAEPQIVGLTQRYVDLAAGSYPTSIFSTMAAARAWVVQPMPGWARTGY